MSHERTHDLVVFGATGYTGRLVSEHLRERDDCSRWAIAGRDLARLASVRRELGLGDEVDIVVADTGDQPSIDAMVADTRVLCTTVGPYQWYGSGVVAACAAHGTHYVDLAGETPWMGRMIEAPRRGRRSVELGLFRRPLTSRRSALTPVPQGFP